MQQAYGQRALMPVGNYCELPTHGIDVQRLQHRPVGGQPFVNLDNVRGDLLRLDDVQFKELRAILIGNLEDVAKASPRLNMKQD